MREHLCFRDGLATVGGMNRVTLPLLGLCLFAAPLRAQVYADLELKHGGAPLGTIRAELHVEQAPRVCANFIGLATGGQPWIDPRSARVRENTPYYDGLIFHRLVHGFVIQGGDPTGTGAGGPGYVFQDQFHPQLRHDGPYRLSMAHSGPHTNGSQFFITLGDASFLDDYHSVFGTIIGGREIVDGFNDSGRFPTGAREQPLTPITMVKVTIHGPGLAAFDWSDPAHGLPRFGRETLQLVFERGHEGTEVFLKWPRRPYTDYTVMGGENLRDWLLLGNVLSVDADPAFRVGVTGVFNPPEEIESEFYQITAIDYSHLPVIAESLLNPGTELRLDIGAGRLRIVFDEGMGYWTYEEDGAVTEGWITDRWEDLSNVLPDSGYFINNRGTYASLLPLRKVTVFFNAPVGPRRLTAIQPTLSFHTADSGWYDGRFNAELPPDSAPFRGPFHVRWPPQ